MMFEDWWIKFRQDNSPLETGMKEGYREAWDAAAQSENARLRQRVAELEGRINGTNHLSANPRDWGLEAMLEGACGQRDNFERMYDQAEAALESCRVAMSEFMSLIAEMHTDDGDFVGEEEASSIARTSLRILATALAQLPVHPAGTERG